MTEYALTLSASPTLEPVTLNEALLQCHAEPGVEDEWFKARIRAGRNKVEDFIKRSLVEQVWILRVDGAIPQTIDLPRSPAIELVSLTYKRDLTSTPVEIDAGDVRLITEGCPARLVMPNVHTSGTLRIEYKAGYASPELIPQPLKDAILLFVSHSYENRSGERDIPAAFFNLIEPYRLYMWIDK